ncbi:MAG: hypothetical protein GY822_08435 [Deltaproteobacteria bacterium]|nr:hypothetical protein [Deltaproteobacteria bacterium]
MFRESSWLAPVLEVNVFRPSPLSFALIFFSAFAFGAGCGVEPSPPSPDVTSPSDAGTSIPTQALAWQNIDGNNDAPPAQWAHFSADLGDGKALLFGGTTFGSFGGEVVAGTYLFDANVFPPSFEKQSPVSEPSPRYCGCMAHHPQENKVLLYGGRNEGTLFTETWVFDLDTGEWMSIPVVGPPGGLGCALSAFSDGEMYLFGGATMMGSTNSLYSFSFESETWSEVSTLAPRQGDTTQAFFSARRQFDTQRRSSKCTTGIPERRLGTGRRCESLDPS